MQPSVPSGFSLLSQEVFDEIVDHFFICSSRKAFMVCALISRVFRDRAQKNLFTDLHSDMFDECQDLLDVFKRLNDIFSTNPRLASHIRSLVLFVKERSDLWKPCFEDRNFVECIAHMSRAFFGQ
ncbi:hypothetical protein M413DRAFT_30092 [Hebeloma cylindrosporum]|uniref:Uncharacterized protein n=1 Tax=Hebeloma cylindrosporum TaxID=76867 RepID=A0A0C2YC24_HEBCY|nr:hypothetical protein M413DRAFT_30092 [Hebeloma cylindrosporum h7]